ncbi:MAG: dCTP deaminase [Candidatus Aenigmarchaeota archaeon]|nr:dCTP deaminase [Candidatus Aenigmarchaeota archaeon]
MILPDHEIKQLLKDGKIVIEPLDDPDTQIQPSCIDLRLGNEFKVFKHTKEAFIDSRDPKEYTEKMNTRGEPFILHPKEFILGLTKESITLPADITGYIDGRSSLGRLGITAHITSGYLDPGFSGNLVLEIANLGKMPVKLFPGSRMCKLILLKMSSPSETPYNMREDAKYKDQNEIIQSKMHKDSDNV